MWFWMEVVKECLLPKMCLKPGVRTRKLWAEQQRQGVVRGQLVLEMAAGALVYLFIAPQESVPKRAWPQQSRDSAAS